MGFTKGFYPFAGVQWRGRRAGPPPRPAAPPPPPPSVVDELIIDGADGLLKVGFVDAHDDG